MITDQLPPFASWLTLTMVWLNLRQIRLLEFDLKKKVKVQLHRSNILKNVGTMFWIRAIFLITIYGIICKRATQKGFFFVAKTDFYLDNRSASDWLHSEEKYWHFSYCERKGWEKTFDKKTNITNITSSYLFLIRYKIHIS